MQAQHYAKTKMDYLVFNGYNNLAEQPKTIINDSEFKDTVILGTVSTDTNGISSRTVTVSIYKDNETHPRATLKQVFYSNDANKFVTNGSSAKSSISMNYDKDNDRLYAMVDGQEKALGGIGGSGGVPVGTIIAWPGTTAPTEGGTWLLCNGQSCVAYPGLVAVVGKNVPDLNGRFLEGSTTEASGVFKEAGLPEIEGAFTVYSLSANCSSSTSQAIGSFFTLQMCSLKGNEKFTGLTKDTLKSVFIESKKYFSDSDSEPEVSLSSEYSARSVSDPEPSYPDPEPLNPDVDKPENLSKTINFRPIGFQA